MGRLIRGISKNARFFITDTTDVIQEVANIHNYDKYSLEVFGKICSLSVLMGATLKGNDKLTLIASTEGYIKNILVSSNASGNIKGYLINSDSFNHLGKGIMRIIRDMGLKEPYTAVTNIDYTDLPNNISSFFYNSEQVPTVISLAGQCTDDGKILCSGAFMLQLLPDADENFITKLEEKIQAIKPMNELMLGGMSLEQIANLLYDDMETDDNNLIEEFEILEIKEIKYQCDCDSERFYRGLLTLGKDELKNIFKEEKEIQTECQFCSKKYRFMEKDFKDILYK